jgi:hypothetical protein
MKSTDDEKFVPLYNKFRATKKFEGVELDTSVVGDPQVFVTSPSLANEIQKLHDRSDFKFELKDIKLPYSNLFVEIPLTPEIHARRQQITGTRRIIRLGTHITSTQDGSCMFWPVWEFDNGEVGFGQIVLLLTCDPLPTSQPINWGVLKSTIHLSFFPPPILLKVAMANKQHPAVVAARFNEMWVAHPRMIDETVCEVSFLLAAWSIVINSKTGIRSTPVRRVAPSGAGRRLKELMNAKYTVLSLSAVEGVCPRGQTTRRRDLSAHFVRGHFKQRKSGIYWWQPFVRGTGAVKRREAYIVKP